MARAIFDKAPRVYSATHDPIAERLIPRNMAKWTHALARAWNVPELGYHALKLVSLGLFEQVALRTAAIDYVVIAAAQQGIKQLVILGAGLDARAFRLKGIEHTKVFELDHPATQQYKKRKTKDVAALAREHHFVSIDFARDRLSERLGTVGFNEAERTLWLLEGVSMYLPREALVSTINQVSTASAKGSRFAITYFPPFEEWLRIRAIRLVVDTVMQHMREPFIGTINTEALHRLLKQHEFKILSDEYPPDWAARYTPAVNPRTVLAIERLVVGEKA